MGVDIYEDATEINKESKYMYRHMNAKTVLKVKICLL